MRLQTHHQGGRLVAGDVGRALSEQHPALGHQIRYPLKVHLQATNAEAGLRDAKDLTSAAV